jgi:serine/threonine-protein kinase ATR
MANTLLDTKSRKIKKGQALAVFLQQHALGLATRFSEIINDSIMLRPPMKERRQCIRALEEMIKLGKSFIRIARPQVRSASSFSLYLWKGKCEG